jgi:NADPH:quinone reductase-like Zn-dependent oxidoreductase
MRAFGIDEFGQPGSVKTLSDPKPEANEVLVRVHAAGVNVIDVWMVNGALKDMMEHRFPLIPGVEASGIVEAVGTEVDGFKKGDSVFGVSIKPFFGEGTFAELATMTGDGIAAAPTSVSLVEVAGVAHAALTALSVIDALGPEAGRMKILVIGATGGVGSYLTQLAAKEGATVIASTRPENADYARSLGASETIDYSKGDFVELVGRAHPEGVDAIVDFYSDGPALTRLSEIVRRDGRVVSASGGADSESLTQRGLQAININRASPSRLVDLAKLIDEGTLKVSSVRPFPLADAASAIGELQDRHVRGKLLVLPN